jgi:hypothetical protein
MTRIFRFYSLVGLTNLATLLLIGLAHAGGISSSGGDNPSADQASAWFLGAQPVRYCIVLDPTFGVSEADAEATIATSFQVWRDYIQQKHINEPGFADGPMGTYNAGNEAVSHAKIIMNTELIASCDQTEDLKFYLGGMNDEVKQYITAFTNPTAFAQRTAYDGLRGWGKGFIWVSGPRPGPVSSIDWKFPFRFEGILLHEIGHVLGNSHIDHTIMREDIASWVETPAQDLTYDQDNVEKAASQS